jgi:hypothetical protein
VAYAHCKLESKKRAIYVHQCSDGWSRFFAFVFRPEAAHSFTASALTSATYHAVLYGVLSSGTGLRFRPEAVYQEEQRGHAAVTPGGGATMTEEGRGDSRRDGAVTVVPLPCRREHPGA